MKKIGGGKFNYRTKQWEGEPIKYVEFHCTREEFKHTKPAYLVRDFLRSVGYYETPEDFTVRICIEDAVREIICKRYSLLILCEAGWDELFHHEEENLVLRVKGSKFPIYIREAKIFPKVDETLDNVEERDLIQIVATVITAIFHSMNVYDSKYLQYYVKGVYKYFFYPLSINDLKL